ncbi:hypothetical protein IQ273_14670 [Nodosilinea sp. LEGE 07298]|uniref:hypothetical protein n=1 Tax=Nodosilinea sp. LEGE 07298 TaxID=2777970 RepID=UPI00187E2A93|nr:hypothetical protein [Nodosilinea sp. LEGE 07298]MBE9110662.1 hypothetical protein [Nodosilinea sp. LEGE 07298]
MSQFNISQAAKITGKARSTIQRDIKKGRISINDGGNNAPVIDASELIRVYGTLHLDALQSDCSDTTPNDSIATPDKEGAAEVQQAVASGQGGSVAGVAAVKKAVTPTEKPVETANLEKEMENLRLRLKELEEDREERKEREKKLQQQMDKILEISTGQERRLLTYENKDKMPKKGFLNRLFAPES